MIYHIGLRVVDDVFFLRRESAQFLNQVIALSNQGVQAFKGVNMSMVA
jgi:hypothetical protein